MDIESYDHLLVVLGAAITTDGKPGSFLQARLDLASRLYENYRNCLFIVSGGGNSAQHISEAEVMREYLIAQGISAKNILCETKSRNTPENAREVKNLLQCYGWQRRSTQRITIVTSDFHLLRTQKIFASFFLGIDILYKGADTPVSPERKRELEDNEQILLRCWEASHQ